MAGQFKSSLYILVPIRAVSFPNYSYQHISTFTLNDIDPKIHVLFSIAVPKYRPAIKPPSKLD